MDIRKEEVILQYTPVWAFNYLPTAECGIKGMMVVSAGPKKVCFFFFSAFHHPFILPPRFLSQQPF